jgi:hypothetical protein
MRGFDLERRCAEHYAADSGYRLAQITKKL